jgi:hypothetical protein
VGCCEEGVRGMCCQWCAKEDDYSVERERCGNEKK